MVTTKKEIKKQLLLYKQKMESSFSMEDWALKYPQNNKETNKEYQQRLTMYKKRYIKVFVDNYKLGLERELYYYKHYTEPWVKANSK